MNDTTEVRSTNRSVRVAAAMLLLGLAMLATPAMAITYQTGDVIYAAYQTVSGSPGPEYIVNLGNISTFPIDSLGTVQISLNNVKSADMTAIFGSTLLNVKVAVFAVANPYDAILATNGPVSDFQLTNSSILGAAGQIDSFGNGLGNYGTGVPGNPNAVSFAGAVTGSYQGTLNSIYSPGRLGGTVIWNVETGLPSASPVNIPLYRAQQNPYTVPPLRVRGVVSFIRLLTNGTASWNPDHDGDYVADYADNCPYVSNPTQTNVDGDAYGAACDCNDNNAAVWAIPTEVAGLTIASDKRSISWSAPANLGGTTVVYDTFRQAGRVTGSTVYGCYLPDLPARNTTDANSPGAGNVFNYLVAAQNACGENLGTATSGSARTGAACP